MREVREMKIVEMELKENHKTKIMTGMIKDKGQITGKTSKDKDTRNPSEQNICQETQDYCQDQQISISQC